VIPARRRYRHLLAVVDRDGRHVHVVELLVLIVAEDHDRVEVRGRLQPVRDRLHGKLDRSEAFRENPRLELREEIRRDGRTAFVGLSHLRPNFPRSADLRAVRGTDAEHDFCHVMPSAR